MLSKSCYKELQKSFSNQAKRTTLTQTSTLGSNSYQQRHFGGKHSISTLSQTNQLFISRTILNKQLHYLYNHKISQDLKPSDNFIKRHLGNDNQNTHEILKALNVKSIDELMDQTVPQSIRLKKDHAFKHNGKEVHGIHSEMMMLSHLREYAMNNKVFKSFQGCGYYPTNLPSVIRRNVLENPNWYTPYTPYQAEISQGRLESLLNFQTMITELTGLDVSNASLLDEATSAAEAMAMSHSIHNEKRNKYFMSKHIFPQNIDVIKTRAYGLGIELVIDEPANFNWAQASEYCGYMVQNPDNLGNVTDITELAKKLKHEKIVVTVIADLLSLAIIKPPGEMGADIAVGSAQRFGVPMAYGGPHPGYMAVRDDLKRKMPGRLIGVSKDLHGNQAFRMALQTREQHIRRDKATSNICTAQALLANIAAFFGQWHGAEGIRKQAKRVRFFAEILIEELQLLEIKTITHTKNHFDTVTINVKDSGFSSADFLLAEFHKYGINLRKIDDELVQIAFNETTSIVDLDEMIEIFAELKGKTTSSGFLSDKFYEDRQYKELPADLKRTSHFMQQPQFTEIQSETQMMRYIQRLADKDIGLTNSMIPLGSCTLKLNSAIAMIPITWHGFAQIHPFAPRDQVQGYLELIKDLEANLVAITQYDCISLQPNSGANGEYAGLMAIKTYHESRGDFHRDVCLIPHSAHGTNPASAALCNMKIVAVECDEKGNVDVEDLKKKAELHKDRLSCFMITYPSTHGVFEEKVKEMCDIVHHNGGQVYMDGANFNAQMGLTSPGFIGADVGHLNLHKTFSIPHGGGGPGVGPIGVKKHLEPFMPGHPVVPINGRKSLAVAAAPYGSAGILPIPYAYIKMMGKQGLLASSQHAIMNANYIASQLGNHFKVLYTGENGRVAHELILDMREFKKTADVTESDIAKRLMDYGFHAPTVSFPVPGSLMIEPTESEDKVEMDRFIDAIRRIRQEIKDIEEGRADKNDNVLKNSPHTLKHVVCDEWKHPYSREQAAYPAPWIHHRGKIFPAVGRIDNTYGDRNLICTCPPVSEFL